jgi:hypothetical protein
MAAPQFKAVLIATPQMRSESGLHSGRSSPPCGLRTHAVARRLRAGKTCYLPRFNIMHRPAMLSGEDRCPQRKGDNQVQISSAWSNREGVPVGRNRYVELDLKRAKSQSQTAKASPAQHEFRPAARAGRLGRLLMRRHQGRRIFSVPDISE